MNERMSFQNISLAVIKDSFKIYFHEMEKLLPVENIFKEMDKMVSPSQKISFH